MLWRCPECSFVSDYSTVKCPCGHEASGEEEVIEDEIKGIGGWLIFPIIGLFLSPFIAFVKLLGDLFLIDSYFVWMPHLLFDILSNLMYIIFPIILLVLMFRISRKFPEAMIYFYVLSIILNIGEALLVSAMPVVVAHDRAVANITAIAMIISSLIWISYFMRSIRVKNTFVK